MKNYINAAFILAVGALAISAAEARTCQWDFLGVLKAQPEVALDGVAVKYPDGAPLEGVTVRISGRAKVAGKWATYKKWQDVKTNADGRFYVRTVRDCAARQIRVRVRFQDLTLEVRHGRSTSSTTKVKWYDLHTNVTRSGGRWNMGEMTFRRGGSGNLGAFEPRRHAQIWVVYRDAQKWLAAQGPRHRFIAPIKVKYPHNGWIAKDENKEGNAVEASYVNPTTKIVYIVRNSRTDQFNLNTLLHELGHVWAYQHTSGEICLTQALLNGGTHGVLNNPCPAYHEGFAQYFADEMAVALWYRGRRVRPWSRAYMRSGGYWQTPVTSLSLMQRSDEGWRSFFHMLDLGGIDKFDFNVSGDTVALAKPQQATCGNTQGLLSFKEVLRSFSNPDGHSGHMTRADTTFSKFLDRAGRIFPKVSSNRKAGYLKLADPANTTQPWSFIRC